MGRKPTVNLSLPAGMRARHRPGKTYYFLDTGGRPRREIALGTDYVAAVQKWAELTVTNAAPAITFKDLADQYVREALPLKAPRTRKDNITELGNLLTFFNDPPVQLEEIEAMHVRQYMDWRGKAAPVRANREKALLSHMWNFAREKGITNLPNPCRGVKGFREDGRDVYVGDEIYQAVYACASGPLKDALDLAYMTGQRPADVRKMSVTDVREGLLSVQQGKTQAKLRMRTTTEDGKPNELGKLLERIAARKKTMKVTDLALICGANGMRMTESALDNAFGRAREKAALKVQEKQPAMAVEIRAFQFRDLRAKAGTDKADGASMQEAQRQLGHSTMKMTEHYVRKGNVVTPTR
jgi:integrase